MLKLRVKKCTNSRNYSNISTTMANCVLMEYQRCKSAKRVKRRQRDKTRAKEGEWNCSVTKIYVVKERSKMGRDQTEKLPCRTSARGWKRESELFGGGWLSRWWKTRWKWRAEGRERGEPKKKKRESFFPFL